MQVGYQEIDNEKEILELAYRYTLEMSNSKPFNIQCIAIKNYFQSTKNNPLEDISYQKDYKTFCESHPIKSAKDFIYKKDYYSTREMYLISPAHYLYYTYNVFQYFYKTIGKEKIDFSIPHFQISYSGIISFKAEEPVKKLSRFNYSYEIFQSRKNEFIGNKVLTIDIKDFFKNISIKNLIDKLGKRDFKRKAQSHIQNLEDFFHLNYFSQLPQLHYSIASSSLSQFYLVDFSDKLGRVLKKERCTGLRFVDDMFIKLPKGKRVKTVNKMLNEITYHLWREGLNLNTSKTKIFDKFEYEKNVELANNSYFDEQLKKSKFPTEKLISDKVEKLVANDAELLRVFLSELKKIADSKGIDMGEYHKLVDQYIAIDGEHVSKVINNLIYGNKWKAINPDILNNLISNNNFIYFNPSQFTVFFILIYDYLKLIKSLENDFLLELINSLKQQNTYTLRESIITVQHFVQTKDSDPELVKRLTNVNIDFVNFVQEYIIRNLREE